MKSLRASIISLVVIASLFCVSHGPTTHADDHLTVHGQLPAIGQVDESGPRVVIEAPTSVKVGDMIIVDLSKSVGEGFDMIIKPTPPQVRVFDNGKVVVTATGYKTTEYTFIVSCALDNKSDVEIHSIKVIGPQPVIPVNPGEDIPRKVLSWCEGVESPTLRDDALKLAQSFASLATVIENGTFQEPGEIVAATKQSNRDALGTNLEYWVPLAEGLMNELKAMAKLGMLPDAEAHGPVWRAVSEGLKAYADELTG